MAAPEPHQHISFFDAIEANKRNSIILIFVMICLFIGMTIAISYIFDLGICGPVVGFLGILLYTVIVYFQGSNMILMMSGAKEVQKQEQPFLFNVVEGLSLASQIPMPKIYLIQDQSPNAFATGRDPKNSAIAVTTGLLGMMNRQELEGVLAHEISHIANYDIRFSMFAIVFVGAIAMMGDLAGRFVWFGGDRRDRGNGGGAIILIALVFAILGPIFAELIRLALSRQRESLADANGARLTRYPAGLASALEKIKNASIPTQSATKTTAPLYFSDPFINKFGSLFATHPPLDERIKRLKSM
ncbi:MAG: zinc metalloprotease HtpX [Candidatus Bilamarchaeum sp.]|jgi:heat shock protein HtpX